MADKALLIVDDEESICVLLRQSLKKWSEENSVKIITETSASKALLYLEENDLDIYVIIADQNMPQSSGTDLIKKFMEKDPDMAAILITGYSQIENIEEIIETGLFAFLSKPWDRKKMLKTVDRGYRLTGLKKKLREQETLLQADLKIASEFQKVFLKVPVPESSLFQVELNHRCANDLYFGGDYYDIFSLGNDRYFFMLGDVAGHGLKASFFTAILKAIIFSEYIKNNNAVSPSDFLEWLNRRLHNVLSSTPDLFIAFSACLLDAGKRKAVFANAGQPPFMVINKGSLEQIAQPEIAIGVDVDAVYTESKLDLDSGTIIVMCTDGLYPAGKSNSCCSIDEFNKLLTEKAENRKGFTGEVMDYVFSRESSDGLFDDDSTIISVRMS